MMKKQQRGGTVQRSAAIEGLQWEMRPGGMLVQKRNSGYSSNPNPQIDVSPTIRVRVKHNSNLHEIRISRHASFGELKKVLAGQTGLHPQDQKLIFKEKERESKQYLDIVGVKEGSRMVLMEDLTSKERRFLDQRRSATIDKAMKSVAEVTMEVDKLAAQVARMERLITKGAMAEEKEVLLLIEQLMAQLIKLDGIAADGDAKLLRKKQVVRVQRHIETLDKMKAQNEAIQQRKKLIGERATLLQRYQYQTQEAMNKTGQVPRLTSFASQQVTMTTKWEKF